MSQDPRLPIEPLSEKRWQDIRRKVLAEAALVVDAPAPERPRVGTVLAALAIAAAMVLAWIGRTSEPDVGLSRVVTDASSATASAGDATLTLAAHTSVLVIERAPDTWVVSLEHGSAHFDVPPRGDRASFTVEAGRTRVVVVGTAFTVTREAGASSASVSVDHGAVRVLDGGTDLVLHDGDTWPAPVVVTIAPPPPEAPAAPIAIAPAPRRPPPSPAPPSPSPIAAPPSARDRYREAESREASDPQAALAAYARLAENGGAWSGPALMSAARLELELGHADRAHALAQRYLVEHPDGINAEDARALLQRAH